MSEFGFDEGSLFDTLSKPKHTIEKFKYNDDGTVKSKKTTTISYWDAVMAIGGPALLFTIYHIIERMGMIKEAIKDMFTDEEIQAMKDHPELLKLFGPVGFKFWYNQAKKHAPQIKEIAEMASNTSTPEIWMTEIARNWGIDISTLRVPTKTYGRSIADIQKAGKGLPPGKGQKKTVPQLRKEKQERMKK